MEVVARSRPMEDRGSGSTASFCLPTRSGQVSSAQLHGEERRNPTPSLPSLSGQGRFRHSTCRSILGHQDPVFASLPDAAADPPEFIDSIGLVFINRSLSTSSVRCSSILVKMLKSKHDCINCTLV